MPNISVNRFEQELRELEEYILTLPIPQSLTSSNPLTDVDQSTAPISLDVLIYDNLTQKWYPGSVPHQSISTLTDVTLTSLLANDILVYDGTKWIN